MNSMRDWPKPLKHNVESIWLAKKIYHATVEVHGGMHVSFSELMPEVKSRFIAIAGAILLRDERKAPPIMSQPAHVAPFKRMVVARAGMLRCCRETIEDAQRDLPHSASYHPEGAIIGCRHCGSDLKLVNGVWEWIDPQVSA